MGMTPFGALLAGALASRIGPAQTVGLGGACTLAAALAFAVRTPRLFLHAVTAPSVAGGPTGESSATRAAE
jgi:hypothetical protein